MPIKRPPAASVAEQPPAESEASHRINPEVNARLDAFIAARPGEFERYTKLVKEDPAHAVRTLMVKDLFRHEGEMKFVAKQLPEAKRFLESQAPEVQAEIKAKLEGVDPLFADKALVNEVFSYMTRQSMAENRRKLLPPRAAMAAG